jgi:hypothetical protein
MFEYDYYYVFGPLDFLGVTLVSLIIFPLFYLIGKSRYKKDPSWKFFMPGLTIKIIGGILVGLFYFYNYGGGDTINFFRGARQIANISTIDLEAAIHYMTRDAASQNLVTINNDLFFARYGIIDYYNDPQNYTMVVLMAPFALLGLLSYSGTSMYVSAICFIGAWCMYRALLTYYPNLQRVLGLILFYLPTLAFWGSGIFKDSLALACIGIMFYAAVKLLKSNFTDYRLALYSIPLIYVVTILKEYVIFSFLPMVVFFVVLSIKDKIENKNIRLAITPFFFVVSMVGGYFVLSKISEDSQKYSLEKVGERAEMTYQDLTKDYYYTETEGSVYDIGDFDAENPLSLIPKIPVALSVTFIRPFFWEVNNNPFMLFSALESAFILIVIVYIFSRVGIVRTIRLISSRPLLTFFFLFSLAFGFMVGLTSGNYGNLARYKIPCIPFFMCGLYILLEEVKIERKNLLEERKARKEARQRFFQTPQAI